jgi:hypothetical protein
MIVSHEHRFIFIKTRKTAGTSIEMFLSRLAGDDAIVTPVHPPVPGHEPRHHDQPYNPVRAMARTRSLRPLRHRKQGRSYFNHMPGWMVRERIGPRVWNSYYKFCFERDPWDKVVSWYHFRVEDPEQESFAEFVRHRELPSDFDLYARGGAIDVDFVGRYEHLTDDLGRALGAVGIDVPVELPRAKGDSRPAGATVDAVYTPELDARVAAVFHREIAAFKYPDRSRPDQ